MPELNIDGIQFEKKQIKLENDSDGEHSSIDNQGDDFPLDSESEEEKTGKIEDVDSSNDVRATSYKHILSSSDTASDADTDCSKHASKIAQPSSKASSDSEDQDDSSVSDTDSDGDGVTFPDNLLVSSEDSSDDDVPRNQSEESDSDTDNENSGEN
ncbi:hypothetical protein PsorP6_004396 [Peronosclerospora sorghi]|uniref:Uncharacterized protein n=1 Tax=Peronosclerospora sorghi TaxID=230839 RepID=A0ACC0VQN4_9STRA|nr:hypothetical protein PsorP6_004396 [Peronosclerospora sorghi]